MYMNLEWYTKTVHKQHQHGMTVSVYSSIAATVEFGFVQYVVTPQTAKESEILMLIIKTGLHWIENERCVITNWEYLSREKKWCV